MRLLKVTTFSTLVVLLASSLSFGQTPDTTTPTTTPPAPTSKAAISKACTDQANQQGLHGKKRKTFRAQCKKNGGNPT